MSARGFTLIELVVCIAIFAMMTALIIAKYGTFNQSVLLTDLAYDTAITIRTAQTYGLSVQQAGNFQSAYGVDFCAVASGCGSGSFSVTNQQINLFADADGDHAFGNVDFKESLYTITRGAIISGFCFADGCTSQNIDPHNTRLDVTFKRPNPDAIIMAYNDNPPNWSPYSYAAIFIKGTDGSTRQVIVRGTGQVSVQQ